MQQLLRAPPPVTPSYRLTAEWREIITINADNIFSAVTAQDRALRDVPEIDGETSPKWMQDCAGTFAVVKGNLTHREPCGAFQSVAHEKIVSDIAQDIGLPVPLVFVWAQTLSRRHTDYFSVSPRISPDARNSPPPEILMADELFPAAMLLDAWTQNADRVPFNVLYGKIQGNPKVTISLPDNELALLMAPEMMGTVLKYWYCWDAVIRDHVREHIATSPVVHRVMSDIENYPDARLDLIVNCLPNPLFCTSKSKRRIIDGMKRGRDMLHRQVDEAFGLA